MVGFEPRIDARDSTVVQWETVSAHVMIELTDQSVEKFGLV